MKTLLCVFLLLSIALGAFSLDYAADVEPAFEQFAQDMASTLPFNASIGLGWSDAYIGQFPRFGVGVTVGATTIPFESVKTVLDAFSITLPAQFRYVEQYGFPVPAYTLDARIGGFGIPFDIGVKVGYVPPDMMQKMGLPLSLNYLLAGADIRFALLKDKGFVPALSLGAGYTFMKGSLSVPGLMSGDVVIGNFRVPDGLGGFTPHTLSLTNPSLNLSWDTNVIEVKAELSKTLLIFTPYLGAGALFAVGSHAGGGVQSSLLLDTISATQPQIDEIIQAFTAAGQTPPDLSTAGIIVQKAAPVGWAGRLFGGVSMNLLVLRLDLGALYSFPGGSFGGSANLRFQL
jgi:hypothetical protein